MAVSDRDLWQVHHRQACLVWLRSVMSKHPGGIVLVHTAATVLGVTTRRVRDLAESGKLTIVRAPWGGKFDQFVPVDELIGAPMRLFVGRRGKFGGNRDIFLSDPDARKPR